MSRVIGCTPSIVSASVAAQGGTDFAAEAAVRIIPLLDSTHGIDLDEAPSSRPSERSIDGGISHRHPWSDPKTRTLPGDRGLLATLWRSVS